MTSVKKYHTLAVGVTGGIGSGKTEASRFFETHGVKILYADIIARELIDTQLEIKKKIKRLMGEQVYTADGYLDRKQVAKSVFYDAGIQEQMNAIVHPFVLEDTEKKIKEAKRKSTEPMIMTEAALIFESGADRMLDYIIVVDADEQQRISRVMRRDNVSRIDVLQRIKAQMSVKEKIDRADFVIHNNGNTSELEAKCKFIYEVLCRIAEGSTA